MVGAVLRAAASRGPTPAGVPDAVDAHLRMLPAAFPRHRRHCSGRPLLRRLAVALALLGHLAAALARAWGCYCIGLLLLLRRGLGLELLGMLLGQRQLPLLDWLRLLPLLDWWRLPWLARPLV